MDMYMYIHVIATLVVEYSHGGNEENNGSRILFYVLMETFSG